MDDAAIPSLLVLHELLGVGERTLFSFLLRLWCLCGEEVHVVTVCSIKDLGSGSGFGEAAPSYNSPRSRRNLGEQWLGSDPCSVLQPPPRPPPPAPPHALGTLSLFFPKSFEKETRGRIKKSGTPLVFIALKIWAASFFSICQKYVIIVKITANVQLNKDGGKGQS